MEAAMKSKIKTHIRWMIRRDMPEVLAIDGYSDHPWGENEFLRVLRHHKCIGMIAELPNELIAGFMVYRLNRLSIEILNFAVDPKFQRHGIGSQLVAKLAGKLNPNGKRKVVATVRESNLPFLSLLRSRGFTAKGIGHDYFDDPHEDAYGMVLRCTA